MALITNGSMYFDPKLHTLEFVRERSAFLLVVILAVASTYTPICSSARLHEQLVVHAARLEGEVRNKHLKSVEIIQAFLLLASWTDVPCTLCRDRTWLYVSHAIALAVELRLDMGEPYCVQTDPMRELVGKELLVRNAHRVCLMMFIHDRVSTKNSSISGLLNWTSRTWQWWQDDTQSTLNLASLRHFVLRSGESTLQVFCRTKMMPKLIIDL